MFRNLVDFPIMGNWFWVVIVCIASAVGILLDLPFWLQVARKASNETWNIAVGSPAVPVAFGVLSYFLPAIVRSRKEKTWDKLKQELQNWWANGKYLLAAIAGLFIVQVLYVTPAKLYSELKTEQGSTSEALSNARTKADGDATVIASLKEQNNNQQTTIDSQQTSIDSLLSQASGNQAITNKLLAQITEFQEPGPPRIAPHSVVFATEIAGRKPEQGQHIQLFVLLTNKSASPVRILVSCETEIITATGEVLTGRNIPTFGGDGPELQPE